MERYDFLFMLPEKECIGGRFIDESMKGKALGENVSVGVNARKLVKTLFQF